MASLIPGYEYDVFISYRQKDNRGERWVSEFVEALKDELDSTFKEEISIYFDINPHDGLLETHEVGESLVEKLKCVVFIPVISRTYCDPKSFAWEHEFMAFIEQAKQDLFGLKVKLPGGNVASRVLPVRIHDLDKEDIHLLESAIGGVLRGIEFIYKSAGVNRPLRSSEEKPHDNLNKTIYRDQINKVALAIKEIFSAVGTDTGKPREMRSVVGEREVIQPVHDSPRPDRSKIILAAVLGIILITAGSVFVSKFLIHGERGEKSIAVLPFEWVSSESEKQYLADGMMNDITLHLQKIMDLRVLPRTNVEQYRKTTKTVRQIGKELNVNYLLEGSFQKSGNNTRLIVQLIKAGTQTYIWHKEYERKWSEIFSVQSEVAQNVAKELDAVITPEEREGIGRVPTTDTTAYDYLLKSIAAYYSSPFGWMDREIATRMQGFLRKAIKCDPHFALAYAGLAVTHGITDQNSATWFEDNYLDSVYYYANKALYYDPTTSVAWLQKGLYYNMRGNPDEAKNNLEKAIKYNPNFYEAYNWFGGEIYGISLKYSDFVKGLEYGRKAARLSEGKQSASTTLGFADGFTNVLGLPDLARKYYDEYFNMQGDTVFYQWKLAYFEIQYGDFKKARERLTRSAPNKRDIALTYFLEGNYEEALKYYKIIAESLKKSKVLAILYNLNSKIGWSYWQNGDREEAEYWFNEQEKASRTAIEKGRHYASTFDPLYGGGNAYYDLACVYALKGEKGKALELLHTFDNCKVISFTMVENIKKYNPMFDSLRNDPEFQKIVKTWEEKFKIEHERAKKWLKDNKML